MFRKQSIIKRWLKLKFSILMCFGIKNVSVMSDTSKAQVPDQDHIKIYIQCVRCLTTSKHFFKCIKMYIKIMVKNLKLIKFKGYYHLLWTNYNLSICKKVVKKCQAFVLHQQWCNYHQDFNFTLFWPSFIHNQSTNRISQKHKYEIMNLINYGVVHLPGAAMQFIKWK